MNKLKSAIRRSRQKADMKNADPVSQFMLDRAETVLEGLVNDIAEELKTMAMSELRKIASTVKKGDKGDAGLSIRGPKGDKGDTVVGPPGPRGPAYSKDELIALIMPLLPDAIAGQKGKDGKDGRQISRKDLLAKLNSKNSGINLQAIKGLEPMLKNLQRAIRESAGTRRQGGGGMTIDAGSNITLTRNHNGRWTIAATSGGGSSISTEKVTAVTSGSDVTIDLTQLANTSTGVLFVTRNGQMLMPNGNANLPGSSWSQSGSTVTVYNADSTDIYLVQYSHA